MSLEGKQSESRPTVPSGNDAADIYRTLEPMGRAGQGLLVILLAVLAWGLWAYIYQLRHGLIVTAMRDYFCWGVYIINFVFFIGISMAGTLISAMLRLTGTQWRGPITRLAEGITLFALLIAGPMVIIDMGRPDRFFHIFEYPRLQSPILWDVFSLLTYMAGSLLYLYLPLIPDLARLRESERPYPSWRRWLYRKLALGWQGTPRQWKLLKHSIAIMAVTIIPVAISIHTVTAWIFGMTLRPGWHSTIIGPDFVVGALYSGIAAVITVMALFRRFFHLERHLTVEHFRKLGILLLAVGLVYLYFTINGYIGSAYTTQVVERNLLSSIFQGSYAVQFWAMVTIGMVLPLILLAWPWTRTLSGIVIASLLVNVGMWLMRFIIVVPTLSAPFLPAPRGVQLSYVPTWVEWSITLGGFAAFGLLYFLFAKIFPIVSVWETSKNATAAPEAGPAPGRAS